MGFCVGAGVGDKVGFLVGLGEGLKVGSCVGANESVGDDDGVGVGPEQMPVSVAEHIQGVIPLALHTVAPQHEYGAPPSQAVQAETLLRSAGPEHPPTQSRDPVPAYFELRGHGLWKLRVVPAAWIMSPPEGAVFSKKA
mmetsp:Transcript_2604/g.5470  ORF Transcript_2604/g.5470 Transcript_2604/m.5470 type:complete len:139 (+) Transcript_2604:117-533(+)